MDMTLLASGEIVLRLIIALALGVLIGVERVYAHKTAGMRTYGLVSMGSALFVLISLQVLGQYGIQFVDPMRMAAAIVTGIGFLGAGLIIFKDNHVANLTTAAGLWVSAGIGMAVAFGLYVPALLSTLLTLFVFEGLSIVERKMKTKIGDTE